MEVYTQSQDADLLVLRWWSVMLESGDIGEAFSPDLRTPSAFLHLFQPPTALFYEHDDQGIAVAFWCVPALSGAIFNIWARPDWRKGRWHTAIIEAAGAMLKIVPVLLFATRQPNVVAAATQLGCTVVGTIPNLYLGQAAQLGYITKQQFEERYGSWR